MVIEGSTTDQIFMDDLKKEFIETVAQNLVDMKRWCAENKLEEIERVAHDIKGTSGIFGLDEGTEIARELHIAARDREIEKTKMLIDKLTNYMKENGII
ncbi:MAG: Hpt domain-containing protein [Acidobacteria bacterium]|jgi:chemotaxis protein histidine kinase CheA|nr:Hpt domain-containing protein [Acidobacteriota bacterium]